MALMVVGCDESDNAGDTTIGAGDRRLDATPTALLDASLQDLDAGQVDAQVSEASRDADVVHPLAIGLNAVSSEDQLLADLEVVALGSRATTITIDAFDEESIDRALARARRFSEENVSVLLSVNVVRGQRVLLDQDAATPARMKQVVDQVYSAAVPLHALVFGEGADVHLANVPADERAALFELLADAIAHAAEHPKRPTGTRVGFAVTLEGWTDKAEDFRIWTAESDVVALSWFGLADTGRALADTIADARLEDALDVAEREGLHVALSDVSYPNATSAGSNRAQQQAFYDSLLSVVDERADTVPFFAVSALDSPTQEQCEVFQEDFRLPSVAVDARCSIALRTATGDATPAYQTLVETMATLDVR